MENKENCLSCDKSVCISTRFQENKEVYCSVYLKFKHIDDKCEEGQ